jgi:hypothetical protein
MENILRHEIFSNNVEINNNIKVSCAECVLSTVQNGFACILTAQKSRLEEVIQNAEQNRNEKEKYHKLHHDHAQFLHPITLAGLRDMKCWKKSFINDLIREKGKKYVKEWEHCWEEGPHLLEMMVIFKNRRVNNAQFMMIMFEYTKAEENKTNNWKLDIPGGKRYLGEKTLDCAIRETEEETSVHIHEKWRKSNICCDVNCYYCIYI